MLSLGWSVAFYSLSFHMWRDVKMGGWVVRSGLFGLADKSFGHQVVSAGKNKRRRRWRVCKLHLREREMSEERRLPLGGHCLLTLCTGFTRTAARGKKAGE